VTIEDQIEVMQDRLASLRETYLADGAGELGCVCLFDHYPTPLTCTCGHGHNRHAGKPGNTSCMSYIDWPDCACTEFVPDAASVTNLWKAHWRLLRAVDFDAILALIPVAKVSEYVRDWPQDEQDLYRSPDWMSFTERAEAMDIYRRRKAALALVTALVGAS